MDAQFAEAVVAEDIASTTKESPLSGAEIGWRAAVAAYEAADEMDSIASRARMAASRAETEILREDHPLCVAEREARMHLFAARDAVTFKPIPHDYDAFWYKLKIVREYADDVLSPDVRGDMKVYRREGEENWPGTGRCVALWNQLKRVKKGGAIPPLAPQIRQWADEITYEDVTGRTGETFDPADPSLLEAAVKAYATGNRHAFEAIGCVALYIDALRLDGEPTDELLYPTPDCAKTGSRGLKEAVRLEAWGAAYTAYHAARAEYEAASARGLEESVAGWLEANVAAELLRPTVHYRLHFRWLHPESVMRDPLLTTAEKARLAPMVEEAHRAFSSRLDRDGESNSEEAYARLCDLEDALLTSPAPDLAAIIAKSRVLDREADDNKFGIDDLGMVAFYRDYDWQARHRVNILTDLLRINGVSHPAIDLPAFSPSRWSERFEAAGGKVVSISDDLLLIHPTTASADADALLSELDAYPWCRRAVQLLAEARRGTGGDPFFHYDMTPRPRSPFHTADRVFFYRSGDQLVFGQTRHVLTGDEGVGE